VPEEEEKEVEQEEEETAPLQDLVAGFCEQDFVKGGNYNLEKLLHI
jgi:hypothetical protein